MGVWGWVKRTLGGGADEDGSVDPPGDARHSQRDEPWGDEADEAARRAEAEAMAREERVAAVRIITGDITWRYEIMNTIRAYARTVQQTGRLIDPTASTDTAVRLLQEEADEVGAQAVIHAHFQILRFEVPGERHPLQVYETHAFGTAVRILGPPSAEAPDPGPEAATAV